MAIKPAKNCVDIGIIVKDIQQSLAFYNGVLGLEKLEEVPLWFGTMHRLHFGDSFVKLIAPKKVPAAGTLGLEHELGFRYLTFNVTNLDEICADCEAQGYHFEFPKKSLRPGVTIAMVRDPDGNVVEFVQRG
ncbi:MAG: VOC family protein [Candidatus Lambdaproteobacteria bacterium]|nr:VOC family protein [Candidatus Lambdaproteobacteria bacterium]